MYRSNFRQGVWLGLLGLVILLALASCAAAPAPSIESPPSEAAPASLAFPTATAVPTPSPFLPVPSTDTPLPATQTSTSTPTLTSDPVRFAVIGDYGSGDQDAAAVAELVKGWNPDLIITTGDNNYYDGEAETIDENIGQFYHEFIFPYKGSYGPGAQVNRFFPSLGNHDWSTRKEIDGQVVPYPYLDYFELPGNERYYDFVSGPVHFFALDSDSREPDGVGSSSIQAQWLKDQLAASTAPWKIVYMHHPPYSSGRHGNIDWMQWPFDEWGASAVLSGHDHVYERIILADFPYFVNGLGGYSRYSFETPVEGSQVRYRENYGAMLVEAGAWTMNFQFINIDGEVIDSYQLELEHMSIYLPLVNQRNTAVFALAPQ
jgi:tartrate-resistant acid phosphatase type 5